MHKVVCFGEVLWDKFPSGKKPGGAPLNVALHLYKQGINSSIISSIGQDRDGEELSEFITKHGLSTQYLQRHHLLPTGVVDVQLDETQQATYTIVEPVAWDEIGFKPEMDALLKGADALVYGSLACRSVKTRNTLLRLTGQSEIRIFDMNLRPPHFEPEVLDQLIGQATLFKINEYELEYLKNRYNLNAQSPEDLLSELNYLTGVGLICVTLGDKGAMVFNQGDIHHHPGFRVKVADTVGAGDAFLAAFTAGYLQKSPVQKILENACATGALVASRAGANPEYELSEVSDLIKC